MKKFLIVFCVLLLVGVGTLSAQARRGDIRGTVTDSEGNPLVGVTVTLYGPQIDEMTAITNERGVYRFLSLFPGSQYTLKFELSGFKTRTEENVIVRVGVASEIDVEMELGAIEEEVTVTAVTPTVDTKKTTMSTTMDYEALQSLPSARDPWVILQMTPAVQVDRENVGGNESGQQASYVAMGGGGGNDTWTFDGVNITDPTAMGASPTYYDYDVFEEINVTIGGADVTAQTAGVAINFVSRRGGNRTSVAGRFYMTDKWFQNHPPTNWPEGTDYPGDDEATTWDQIRYNEGYGFDGGYNQIRSITDYGFNAGGPIIKDKVWWWGSYGVQDIKTTVMWGSDDDTLLKNYSIKFNLQPIAENRAEIYLFAGGKWKYGRSSSTAFPSGWNQAGKYYWGSPIIKIQDEHMFGDNLFVSAKFGFTDAGFGMWPANDMDLSEVQWYDAGNQKYITNGNWWFMTARPNMDITLDVTYFNDSLFGLSHEIKTGFEFNNRYNYWSSGNAGHFDFVSNYNSETLDWDKDGDRDVVKEDFGIDIIRVDLDKGTFEGGPEGVTAWAAYLQDTITSGRLTLKLGARFDHQGCYNAGEIAKTWFMEDSDAQYFENYYELQRQYFSEDVITALNQYYTDVTIPRVNLSDTVAFDFLSPRLALTYDLTGDGKTVAKFTAGIFGARMYSARAYLFLRGGAGGDMDFWWWDKNSDTKITKNEMYWADYATRIPYPLFDKDGNFQGDWNSEYGYMWSGFDPQNPTKTTDPYYNVDPDLHGEYTYEAILTLEREVFTDFQVGVDLSWRRYHGWMWWRSYLKDYEYGNFDNELVTRDDYVPAPNPVPTSFTDNDGNPVDLGDAAGRDWYVLSGDKEYNYGYYVTNIDPDYHDRYLGATIRAHKRLSNGWMFNASFTYQDQRNYYGEEYPLDVTNRWATDGKIYAYSLGGASGKLGMPVFSRWMFKAQGLYQLPYDFDISFSLNAREGHIIPHSISFVDYTTPYYYDYSGSMFTEEYGTSRLPTFWNANLRLQKVLTIGDIGKAWIIADVFNVFNSSILNRQRNVNPGTMYLNSGYFWKNKRSGEPNEVLNPRVVRFGFRFQF